MNPYLLIPEKTGSGGKKRKKKPNVQNIPNTNMQQKLIERVREARSTRKRRKQPPVEEESANQTDFQSSLQYLNEIIKKKQEKRELKKQRKAKRREERLKRREERRHNVTVKITHKDDPPYGNLKNGKKPTYSQYKQSIQFQTPATPHHSQPKTPEPRPVTPIHVDKTIPKLVPKLVSNPTASIGDAVTIDAPRIKRKRRKKKYTLGKKDRVVGILIKNRQTRKKIAREHKNLKNVPIKKIKLYLKKHGLIKVGSVAPDHVLRNIYETSILSGDVFNIKNQIHNFITT